MSVRLQLCFAVLFLATVEAQTGGVSFWLKNFTMTCPEKGKWYEGSTTKNLTDQLIQTFEVEYNDRRKYRCEYNTGKYYFYVQGKVCDNCFELDGWIWAAIIITDMLLTMVVMAVVYKRTKSRTSAGLPHTPKAGSHPGGRAPPVPSADYERLNPHTLSQGTYSEVHTNRAD